MTGKVTQGSVAVPPGSWLVLEDVFCLSPPLRSHLPELVGCLPSWFNHLPLPSGEEHVQGSSPEPVPVPKKGCRKGLYQQELSPMAQKQTGGSASYAEAPCPPWETGGGKQERPFHPKTQTVSGLGWERPWRDVGPLAGTQNLGFLLLGIGSWGKKRGKCVSLSSPWVLVHLMLQIVQRDISGLCFSVRSGVTGRIHKSKGGVEQGSRAGASLTTLVEGHRGPGNVAVAVAMAAPPGGAGLCRWSQADVESPVVIWVFFLHKLAN